MTLHQPIRYLSVCSGVEAAADCPDGPRYKALGNSMAVPVMRWIGERIQAVDGMLAEARIQTGQKKAAQDLPMPLFE